MRLSGTIFGAVDGLSPLKPYDAMDDWSLGCGSPSRSLVFCTFSAFYTVPRLCDSALWREAGRHGLPFRGLTWSFTTLRRYGVLFLVSGWRFWRLVPSTSFALQKNTKLWGYPLFRPVYKLNLWSRIRVWTLASVQVWEFCSMTTSWRARFLISWTSLDL